MSARRVCGIHAVTGLLERRPQDVEVVLFSESRSSIRLAGVERLAEEQRVKRKSVTSKSLNNLARGVRHQGVIALCTTGNDGSFKGDFDAWLESQTTSSLIVVLDSIEDPRNLGACLRSASAAGVDGVILPRNRGCQITETVSKTAVGAVDLIPIIQVPNLVRALEILQKQGFWLIGLEADASTSIYNMDLAEPCVLVFGGEQSGLRVRTRNTCDFLAKIPMHSDIQSLNVSVAVGIGCFEVRRQRAIAANP